MAFVAEHGIEWTRYVPVTLLPIAYVAGFVTIGTTLWTLTPSKTSWGKKVTLTMFLSMAKTPYDIFNQHVKEYVLADSHLYFAASAG